MARFHLPLVTAVSSAMMALTGCSGTSRADRPTQFCVGEQDRRVPDAYCEQPGGQPGGGGGHFYRWYYMSRGGAIPPMGDPALGGAPYPSGGATYSRVPSPSVVRGGFGSSAEGSVGG